LTVEVWYVLIRL